MNNPVSKGVSTGDSIVIVTHSFAIDWAYILSVASFLNLLVGDFIPVLLLVDNIRKFCWEIMFADKIPFC